MSEARSIVYVVDDDDGVRGAVTLLLETVQLEVQAFSSAREFLSSHAPDRPGCLVLDLRMPGMSGLELQEKLVEIGSALSIVFVTGHGDVPAAVAAIQHGAVDFLQKPFRDEELLRQVRKALDRSEKAVAARTAAHDFQARFARLTERERQVLEEVLTGKPNKAIAHDLGVSERTVEVHRRRVMDKLEAGSLAELVEMVVEQRRSD